jgi:DNA-binding CsgD family transcriptional regulator
MIHSGALLPRLTNHQRDVFVLLTGGMANKHIAWTLQLGVGAVKGHVTAPLRLLNVTNPVDAARLGARLLGSGHDKKETRNDAPDVVGVTRFSCRPIWSG